MTPANYNKVIQKLVNEIPFLCDIELYCFGEPLLNPFLPEIVEINSRLGILTGLSTNLNCNDAAIENLIKVSPNFIKVSVSGYGPKNYNVAHKGGSWEKLYQNLFKLQKYLKQYSVTTKVMLYFLATKNNVDEYKDIHNLAKELGFGITETVYLVFPDLVLKYLDGVTLTENEKNAIDLMPVSLEEMLQKAKADTVNTCMQKNCIPVIGWDLSVLTCCNISKNKISDNYLEHGLKEIIALRSKSDLCKKCLKYCLHRYFNEKYYEDYISKMIYEQTGLVAAGLTAR